MENQTVIFMKDITKSFNGKQALNGVECDVKKQEIFGLLGPSGAGKTTIIRILTGMIKADSGQSSLFGVPCDKLNAAVYNDIGMVLDEAGLYTRLTCYDNMLIFAKIHNIDKSLIKEALEKVELGDSINKQVMKLSKGMTQRLVFARAILNTPKLLFLDEPTSGLDPSTALKMHKLIRELQQKGTTVFLTTHNMQEATKLCDNVALLNEGKIVEYGNPEHLCNKYNTKQKINVTLKDGTQVECSNSTEDADKVAEYIKQGNLRSLHTSEPNLEKVFIDLTGRGLE